MDGKKLALSLVGAGAILGLVALFLSDKKTVKPAMTVSFCVDDKGGMKYRFLSTIYNAMPPITFEWSFGDGSISAAHQPIHIYTAAGTYIVSLRITDLNGETKTATQSLIVTDSGEEPVPAAIEITNLQFNLGDWLANPLDAYMAEAIYISHDGNLPTDYWQRRWGIPKSTPIGSIIVVVYEDGSAADVWKCTSNEWLIDSAYPGPVFENIYNGPLAPYDGSLDNVGTVEYDVSLPLGYSFPPSAEVTNILTCVIGDTVMYVRGASSLYLGTYDIITNTKPSGTIIHHKANLCGTMWTEGKYPWIDEGKVLPAGAYSLDLSLYMPYFNEILDVDKGEWVAGDYSWQVIFDAQATGNTIEVISVGRAYGILESSSETENLYTIVIDGIIARRGVSDQMESLNGGICHCPAGLQRYYANHYTEMARPTTPSSLTKNLEVII